MPALSTPQDFECLGGVFEELRQEEAMSQKQKCVAKASAEVLHLMEEGNWGPRALVDGLEKRLDCLVEEAKSLNSLFGNLSQLREQPLSQDKLGHLRCTPLIVMVLCMANMS